MPPAKKKSTTDLNLVQKLAKIMAGIEPMHKSESAGSGNYGYKFISVNAMIDIARPQLAEAGIIFYGDVESMERFSGLGKNGNQTFIYLTVRWHVRDGDEEFHFSTVGEASDTGDKATNKAMTAAQKQAISKLLMMSGTDDDPDRVVSPPDAPRQAPAQRTQPAPKPATPERDRATDILRAVNQDMKTWPGLIETAVPALAGKKSADLTPGEWAQIADAVPRPRSGEPTEVSNDELPEGWSDGA